MKSFLAYLSNILTIPLVTPAPRPLSLGGGWRLVPGAVVSYGDGSTETVMMLCSPNGRRCWPWTKARRGVEGAGDAGAFPQ